MRLALIAVRCHREDKMRARSASRMTKCFRNSEMRAIADSLGDTSDGLTGSEIGHLLTTCKMTDPTSDTTSRHRMYNAFAASQNGRLDRIAILAFIRHSMKPTLYARQPGRYEPMRRNLNRALAFAVGERRDRSDPR
jgi:hypothetical protein